LPLLDLEEGFRHMTLIDPDATDAQLLHQRLQFLRL
jgi:hypothetical protein